MIGAWIVLGLVAICVTLFIIDSYWGDGGFIPPHNPEEDDIEYFRKEWWDD